MLCSELHCQRGFNLILFSYGIGAIDPLPAAEMVHAAGSIQGNLVHKKPPHPGTLQWAYA